MPFSDTLISGAIKAQSALIGFSGRNIKDIADAVGRAIFIHLSVPNMTSSTLSGIVGPIGSINSLAVAGIVPNAMSSLMKAKGAQNGFTGRDMAKLSDALSNGICQVLMTMVLSGTSAGLAMGVGTAKFVGIDTNTLGGLIKSQLKLIGFTGRDLSKLADMVTMGVITHLKSSATFTVTAMGAIAPTPPTGPLAITGIPSIFTKIS